MVPCDYVISSFHCTVEIYTCEKCNYRTQLKWNLANHVKIHSAEKPFACEVRGCDFRTRLVWNLTMHTRRRHDPIQARHQLPCKFPACVYKTTEEYILKRHEETHNPNRNPKFVCSLCPNGYHGRQSLKNHIAAKHTGEQCYSCTLCKFSSRLPAAFKRHMETAHASDPIRQKYKCSLCSYSSSFKQAVIKHANTHSGDKPFACDVCSHKAKTKSDLNSHVKRMHEISRRKQFQCEICKAKFVRILNMKQHVRMVHDESAVSFPCEFCNHFTKYKGNLKAHIKSKHECGAKSTSSLRSNELGKSLELYFNIVPPDELALH